MRAAAQRGSASVWVLAGGALVMLVALGLATRVSAVAARHRTESAADLAALAAADGIGRDDSSSRICGRAARIAMFNGAALASCVVVLSPDGRSGTVAVSVDARVRLVILGRTRVSARARAGRLPAARRGLL